eukprot:CAMPEP_0195525396 /NCGR_PEP_ID=MMETSP0794_2-20130614/25842_1 /TAXON_ID=515487 /ORGANISM="Stephanopyxis turris, Strain CCMP 815" /LENGTH=211 /DNA_ID=CAMNT_0040655853 /DNA_START=806 /DNA_END=1437 /DNA_ORIENTATION=+
MMPVSQHPTSGDPTAFPTSNIRTKLTLEPTAFSTAFGSSNLPVLVPPSVSPEQSIEFSRIPALNEVSRTPALKELSQLPTYSLVNNESGKTPLSPEVQENMDVKEEVVLLSYLASAILFILLLIFISCYIVVKWSIDIIERKATIFDKIDGDNLGFVEDDFKPHGQPKLSGKDRFLGEEKNNFCDDGVGGENVGLQDDIEICLNTMPASRV